MATDAQLGDAAARHVRATLVHIDRLLGSALRHGGISVPDAFSHEYDDFTADEVFLLSETAAEVRTMLQQLLDALGISPEPPTVPARWTVQTDWQLAEVALAELTKGSLRAWGGADPELERRLAADAKRLRTRLADARALLAEGHPGRRAAPETLAPGPALAPLRELFKLSELAPLHGALRAVADNLRDPDLVIGVFGRVSTGKSSLVNAILGESVLPTGAIPVTRRLLRVRHGANAVRFLSPTGEEEVHPWSERAHWLAQSAGDGKRCELLIPAVLPGTAWLDTPGLGATDPALGAAAPRAVSACDLVVLTLGAGALPGLDERAILARARAQSIPVHLVLTQADRLRPAERDQLLDWLQENVAEVASIGAVSTTGNPGLAHLADILRPLLDAPEHEREARRTRRLQTVLEEARRMIDGTAGEHSASDAHRAVKSALAAIPAMVSQAPRKN
ncbi:MAG: dynamin family protein [Gammaproteobacteria bacterium]